MKLPDRDQNLRALANDVLEVTDWGLQQLHEQATRRPEITDIVEMYRDQLNGLRVEAQGWTDPTKQVTVHDLTRVMHQSTGVLLQVVAEARAHDPGVGAGALHEAFRAVHWLTVAGRPVRILALYLPLTVGALAGVAAASTIGRLRRTALRNTPTRLDPW
jgi:hypothetical protein